MAEKPGEDDEQVIIFPCQVCEVEKPATEFPKNRWGITRTCKECRKSKKTLKNKDKGSSAPSSSDDGENPIVTLLEQIGKACIVAAEKLRNQ